MKQLKSEQRDEAVLAPTLDIKPRTTGGITFQDTYILNYSIGCGCYSTLHTGLCSNKLIDRIAVQALHCLNIVQLTQS